MSVWNIFTTKLYARACSTYKHFLGKLLTNKLMKQGYQQPRRQQFAGLYNDLVGTYNISLNANWGFSFKVYTLIFQLFFVLCTTMSTRHVLFLYRGPCLLCSRFVLFLWPYEIEFCSLTSYFILHLWTTSPIVFHWFVILI